LGRSDQYVYDFPPYNHYDKGYLKFSRQFEGYHLLGVIQIINCKVTEPETLKGVTKDAKAVVTCLGSRFFEGTDGTVWTIDRDATLNVWQEALKTWQETKKGRT
jgi:hypothetical protein